MKTTIKLLSTLLCAMLVLTACSKTIDISLEPKVKVFFSDNKEKTITLKTGDEAYDLLDSWLKSHQGGWLTASGQFAGGVYILSGEYGIQITEAKVIIYAAKGSKPMALYAQQITRSELKLLKELGN